MNTTDMRFHDALEFDQNRMNIASLRFHDDLEYEQNRVHQENTPV